MKYIYHPSSRDTMPDIACPLVVFKHKKHTYSSKSVTESLRKIECQQQSVLSSLGKFQ